MLWRLPVQPYVFAEWKRARGSISITTLIWNAITTAFPINWSEKKSTSVTRVRQWKSCIRAGAWLAMRAATARASTPRWSEHRPKAHQKHLDWTPSRIVEWAGTIGPFTAQLAERIMAERPHPEQGYRSCMGLIGLGRRYGKERLEAAAQRAIHLHADSYPSVKSILARGLDRQSVIESVTLPSVEHANIRGAGYYAGSLFEEAVE
jgi:hypothetical protein